MAAQGKSISGRVIYFDYLRIIATMAVIAIHVSAQNFRKVPVDSFDFFVFTFWDSIVRFAVPMFVMISGALFLNPQKTVTFRDLYAKYSLRMVTAFSFWSAVYLLYDFFIDHKKFDNTKDFIVSFAEGPYHLWFLFMIVGLYIIVPLLRKITESPEATRYFLIVAAVFTILIPTLLLIPALSDFKDAFGKMKFHFTLGYPCYFVAGYYLSKTELSKKARRLLYALGLLAFLSTIVLSIVISKDRQKPYAALFENFTLNVALETIAVFVFAKYNLNRMPKSKRVQGLIFAFSKYSFGIYLVHILVLDILNKQCGINTLSFNAALSVPALILGLFVISALISFLLNRIPVVNKYIV